MENPIKDLAKDNLRLAILTTLFRVLFLMSILFKTFSFNISKKERFLFKVKLSTLSQRLHFEKKKRDKSFFPLIKEALRVKLFF